MVCPGSEMGYGARLGDKSHSVLNILIFFIILLWLSVWIVVHNTSPQPPHNNKNVYEHFLHYLFGFIKYLVMGEFTEFR